MNCRHEREDGREPCRLGRRSSLSTVSQSFFVDELESSSSFGLIAHWVVLI